MKTKKRLPIKGQLYMTIEKIQWYQTGDGEDGKSKVFEGYNTITETWDYKIEKNTNDVWSLIGNGIYSTADDKQKLMFSVLDLSK